MVHVWIDIHRDCTAENHAVYHAPVHIARKYDLVSPFADGKHHALHRRGRTANHKIRMCRPECLRGKVLCLLNDRDWMAEIVQHFHRIYIDQETLFPQKMGEIRIPLSMFMSRHIKRHKTVSLHFLQCFQYGSA